MTKDIDKNFENLHKLIDFFKSDYSEADTRAKLIDPLFKDCLDWTEADIAREPPTHPGYIDYLFSIDGIRKFVLEAKKTGKYFEIPSSLSRQSYKIRGTITTDKTIKNAIEQAQTYCVDAGVRYGVITNGNQYILFQAFKYGHSWKDTKCIVFRSLEDIRKKFTTFSNILNRNSVKSGSLRRYISQEPILTKHVKPLEKVHNPDGTLIRNYLTPLLQPIIDVIFGELTYESQVDILKECYVIEKQFRKSTSFHIKPLFDRLPHYAKKYHIQQLLETESQAGVFQASFEKCAEFLRYEVPKGSLILLLGGVGTGKTTFIHYFFKWIIKKPRVLWFYIDFKESFPDPEAIADYVYQGIISDYRERYRTDLQKKFADLEHILSNPKPTHEDIVVLFSILNLKGYTMSIVLDNVDRHYLTIPEFQEQALLVARSITNDFKTITILTLREESFFKSKKSGVLDAYNVPKFHVLTPFFDKLIGRRIAYTLNLLDKPEKEIMKTLDVSDDLVASREKVTKFFQILGYSLRRSRKVGRAILRFLSDVSGGDMREALRFINTYCTSGNTNIDEMLYHFDRQGFYDIPFHHIIKSIMLGDSRYYRSTRSNVMNIFDVNLGVTDSYFLHLHLLSYLKDQVNCFSTLDTGYVEIDNILFEAEKILISQNAIEEALSDLAHFGLIEFDNQSKVGYKTATHVRITPTGEYYLTDLIHRFAYLDLIWVDTPIRDQRLVSKLRGLLKKESLDDRFKRTDLFLNYLKEKEEEEHTNRPEFSDSNLTRYKFMDNIINLYEDEKTYIQIRKQEQLKKRTVSDL